MSDALISPAVGGALWAATAGLTAHSARRLARPAEDSRVPLMGVMGAFVFAAQMINFTIPATGSSGHLGGGLLLSVLLGPHAAFLTMASVLTVQALFFADGGLLALGCNIINLGLFTCFIAYPLVWRPLAGTSPPRGRLLVSSIAAAVIGLQLGALGVVLETALSGVSTLPIGSFAALMQPIHLAIGVVEGLITAAVILVVRQARPELLSERPSSSRSLRPLLLGLAVVALSIGSFASWFASTQPDGLEWSMAKASGSEAQAAPVEGMRGMFARIQQKAALLPDYDFRKGEHEAERAEDGPAPAWPAPSAGTSTAGITGTLLVLFIAGSLGYALRLVSRRAARS